MKELIEMILALFKPPKKEQPKDVSKDLLENRKEEVEEYSPIRFKNDNPRLMEEWEALDLKNPGLKDLICDLNDYTNKQFKKSVVITMIYRTDDEQDYLYRNSEKYKKKKFKSPHQFWQAVDLRSRTFTKEEIRLMVNWINRKYNKSNYWKWSAKAHDVGSGMHFHIQWVKP